MDRRAVRAIPYRGSISRSSRGSTGPGPRAIRKGWNVGMPFSSPLRVGIGGPVGSGKTALVDALCKPLRDDWRIAVVTNDIYTKEDARISHPQPGPAGRAHRRRRDRRLPPHRDPRRRLDQPRRDRMTCVERFPDLDSSWSRAAATISAPPSARSSPTPTIYVIDVAGGDKIPRKGGPGITRSDLLVINKIDLAPMVGASLEVMERDARRMRGERPFVFSNLKTGEGLTAIREFRGARGTARIIQRGQGPLLKSRG